MYYPYDPDKEFVKIKKDITWKGFDDWVPYTKEYPGKESDVNFDDVKKFIQEYHAKICANKVDIPKEWEQWKDFTLPEPEVRDIKDISKSNWEDGDTLLRIRCSHTKRLVKVLNGKLTEPLPEKLKDVQSDIERNFKGETLVFEADWYFSSDKITALPTRKDNESVVFRVCSLFFYKKNFETEIDRLSAPEIKEIAEKINAKVSTAAYEFPDKKALIAQIDELPNGFEMYLTKEKGLAKQAPFILIKN